MTSHELPVHISNPLPFRARSLLHWLTHGVFRRRMASALPHHPLVASEVRLEERLQIDQSTTMDVPAPAENPDMNTNPLPTAPGPTPLPLPSSSTADATHNDAKIIDTCDICGEQYPGTCGIPDSLTTPSTESLSKRRKAPEAILINCECNLKYCSRCIRSMFIGSLTDAGRMPPGCCFVFPLFVALPYITAKEAKLFREKFEEWNSISKVYCPIPTCSAFIPERLQPADTTIHSTISCPKCRRHMCSSCHGRAHPDRACNSETPASLELKETLSLVAKWGYKRCPRCGTGVKRMYGCAHIQCVCGAHWCWACQKPYRLCQRTYQCALADEGTDESDIEPDGVVDDENLDARAACDWEAMDLDFGDEPTEQYETMHYPWACAHEFVELQPDKLPSLSFSPVAAAAARGMECCRCWTKVQAVAVPPSASTPRTATETATPGARSASDAAEAKNSSPSANVSRYNLRPRQKSSAASSSCLSPTTPMPTSTALEQQDALAHVKAAWECVACRMLHCKACTVEVMATQNGALGGDVEAVKDA